MFEEQVYYPPSLMPACNVRGCPSGGLLSLIDHTVRWYMMGLCSCPQRRKLCVRSSEHSAAACRPPPPSLVTAPFICMRPRGFVFLKFVQVP